MDKINTTSLSLLRFMGAIIVILYHRWDVSGFFKVAPKIFTAGGQMVTLFFVLSGFVLVLAYYDKENYSLKVYYAKRMARIIPIYLIALFLVITLKIYRGGAIDPIALILNLLLLQSWFPPYPLSINAPAWFLSDLFFFYVSFPIILSYLKNKCSDPGRVLLTGLALWLATQTVLTILLNTSFYKGYPSYSHDLIYYFPPSHFCSFLLGASGAYFLIKKTNFFCLTYMKSIIIILLISFSVVFLIEYELALEEAIKIKLPFSSGFYAPVFLLLIIAFCVSDKAVTAKLSLKPFIILGEISFSIYIMQHPVYIISYHFLKRINIPYEAIMLIYILILIIIGMILLHAIERPISAYMKNKFN